MPTDPTALCAHCGLPAGRRPARAVVDGEAGVYCCYGCVLAHQVTRARGDAGAAAALAIRLGLALFFAMNVMMTSMPTYAPAVYGEAASNGPLFAVLRVLSMILAAPVLLLLGGPVVAGAWRGLGEGRLGSELLVLIGCVAAYGVSAANVVAGRTEVYFDTVTMLLVLVTFGRWLEARARADAGEAVRAALAPAPATATRLRLGRRDPVAPEALRPGDLVEVMPGGVFPTDGEVVDGGGSIDESALTGESLPVVRQPGDAVAGGTCSVDGRFVVRATRLAAESAAARIRALALAALRERTRAERLADRAAAWLMPLVLAVALGAGAWWASSDGLARGVMVALSVLVVACPCALGIATPAAIWTGLAAATERGVVVRNAPVLERLAQVTAVLLDKTGTLTARTPALVALEPAPGVTPARLLERVAALERGLPHPLARAVVAAAADARLDEVAVRDVRIVPGRGVRGVVAGEPLAVGSERFAAEELAAGAARSRVAPRLDPGAAGGPSPEVAARPDAGAGLVTAVAVGAAGILGRLRFRESPLPDAAAAVDALRRLGLEVGLLTGDTAAAALVPAIVRAAEARTGLTPPEKLDAVRAGRRAGAVVAMVGDGINDAPALAAADVGIAVADATDLARLCADVVVLGGDVGGVAWLFAHARRVRRVVAENLLWATGYNLVAVGLAAGGRLTPLVAALAMLASSAAVTANARRLRPRPRARATGSDAAVPGGSLSRAA